jgi:predicted transcriptional regulator
MDVEVYEGLLDEVALLRAVRSGEQEMLRGDVVPHDEVEARMRARFVK